MEDLVNVFDDENRKFWFGISKVDRYQYEEDDPWWNVRIVYKNHWINYDETRESMTELELKGIVDEIEERFIKKERNGAKLFRFIEPDYEIEFEIGFEHAIFIINLGYDNIRIWLNNEELIKISNYICDTLNYRK